MPKIKSLELEIQSFCNFFVIRLFCNSLTNKAVFANKLRKIALPLAYEGVFANRRTNLFFRLAYEGVFANEKAVYGF